MPVVNQLASQLGRNDEEPNIALANQLASGNNHSGIAEIINNLGSKDKNIQSDCIKVVYEIGDINPELISTYAPIFIELLKSRNNRLVWGAMMALSKIAKTSSETIMPHLQAIKSAMENGSVITVDYGVLTLARLASVSESNNNIIFPYLLHHLENCRAKEVPQHGESVLEAVTSDNKERYINVLQKRAQELSAAQLKRIQKIYRLLDSKY